jgi:uncharacterized membrane protein YedE/YeeE
MDLLGLGVGIVFGALLFLSGLANPDKIIGTLRLKDLHAMRVIAVFVLVGLLGVTLLDLFGAAHFSVKPAMLVSVLVGGALLGIGFGLTGFCPGTGLASAASGHLDAFVAALGMLVGALVYIVIQPYVAGPMDAMLDFGKETWPALADVPRAALALPLVAIGAWVLWRTRPRAPSPTN